MFPSNNFRNIEAAVTGGHGPMVGLFDRVGKHLDAHGTKSKISTPDRAGYPGRSLRKAKLGLARDSLAHTLRGL